MAKNTPITRKAAQARITSSRKKSGEVTLGGLDAALIIRSSGKLEVYGNDEHTCKVIAHTCAMMISKSDLWEQVVGVVNDWMAKQKPVDIGEA